MNPVIRSLIAPLSAACSTASLLYSPALLLAIATGQENWRWEMFRPQIERVPSFVHTAVALAFALLAAFMCVDVCAAYPQWKPVVLGGCAAAVVGVAGYWLFWGPI